MTWPSWLRRLVPHLGRHQAKQEFDEEHRLHLDLERQRQREAGLTEPEAGRAAGRTLGNATLSRERKRDIRSWRWADALGRGRGHAARGTDGAFRVSAAAPGGGNRPINTSNWSLGRGR